MKCRKNRINGNGGVAAGIISWLFRKRNEAIRETEQSAKPANEKSDSEISIVAEEVDVESVISESESNRLDPNNTEEIEDGGEKPSVADSRYDENGFDCAGFSQQYYSAAIDSLLNRVCKAGKQMQQGNYEYAVFGAKTATESAAKMLLCHNGLVTGRMEQDIDDCRRYGLITDEMAGRLHGVRLLGNFNGHSFYAPENLTHGQAYFAIMQALEFLSVIEVQLLWPEPLPELSTEWAREPLELDDVLGMDNNEPGRATC